MYVILIFLRFWWTKQETGRSMEGNAREGQASKFFILFQLIEYKCCAAAVLDWISNISWILFAGLEAESSVSAAQTEQSWGHHSET